MNDTLVSRTVVLETQLKAANDNHAAEIVSLKHDMQALRREMQGRAVRP